MTVPLASLPLARWPKSLCCCALALLLAACSTVPSPLAGKSEAGAARAQVRVLASEQELELRERVRERERGPLPQTEKGSEVALFALGLIDTGYRFGGKHPDAGLDCSGMVAYVFHHAAGVSVSGSAADIARRGQQVSRHGLRAGDLIFFNTRNRASSHVGIYIGDERFIHAPSTKGKVRIDRLDNRYYAQRYEMARSYFN